MAQPIEINRGYLDHIRQWSTSKRGGSLRHTAGNIIRLAGLPFLLLLGAAMTVMLRVTLLFKRRRDVLHDEALQYVDGFVDQYPLHLYPIVAKALEMSYLKRRLAGGLLDGVRDIVEIAIGEGTLSARIFEPRHRVTGLDLNPYSLIKGIKQPHVVRGVICDGLNPPVQKGAFDFLISNNFLHHVTEKEGTVANWAKLAPRILFNENTPYWASGWTAPQMLKRLGFKKAGERAAARIEKESMQHLEHIETLRTRIEPHARIEEQVSFMSERTFFYCSLFSFVMRCYGPPTPAIVKKQLLGPLRGVALPLTRAIAKLLIRYDASSNRATDTFVVFLCKTPTPRTETAGALVCPECRTALTPENACKSCGRTYETRDGMLFLLPASMMAVKDNYAPERVESIPDEHL